MSLVKLSKKNHKSLVSSKSVRLYGHLAGIENSFSKADRIEICKFITNKVSDGSSFSIASKFGRQSMDWSGTPLMIIFEKVNEIEEAAAIVLSYFVQIALIESDHEWVCTKSGATKRDFEVNFYWIGENNKKTA